MIASRSIAFRHLLLAATLLSSPLILASPTPAAAQVSIGVSVALPPPALPDYAQPPMPDEGYVWTPGYWGWSQPVGYYWVPGTWVMPPEADVLWTPPYWGWLNGLYYLHDGYWGTSVGYYGGVDYGYGYGGDGYDGGRWQGHHFMYNRSDNNFGSVAVNNAYAHQDTARNRSYTSFAGGPGGTRAEATAADRQAEREHHVAMTSEQTAHVSTAARTPDLAASHNNGRPTIAATARPGQFQGAGVTHAGPVAAGERGNATPTAEARPNEPNGRATSPQAEHAAPAAGAEHPTARAGEPAVNHAAPAAEASHPAARAGEPAMTHAAPAAEASHPAARAGEPAMTHPAPAAEASHPAAHTAEPAVTHAAPAAAEPRPAEHVAAPAPQHVAAPPVQHEAARPVEHSAPAPAAHAAAPQPAREAPHPAAPPQHEAAAAPHPAPAAHPAPAEHEKEH